MTYSFSVEPRILYFKQPAGTSRGIYTQRKVWYLKVSHPSIPGRIGIGECAPLPKLSIDYSDSYTQKLEDVCQNLNIDRGQPIPYDLLRKVPSMLFGIETAIRHWEVGNWSLWESPFSRGEEGIPINGLIWMGDYPTMLSRIREKISLGFRCLKLKIGAIEFDKELSLLRYIRNSFDPSSLEIRVDANGAFTPRESLSKIEQLSHYHIHSIEQPIPAHHTKEMASLVKSTPIPIALDEELIGVTEIDDKIDLIRTVKPHYIIIKPSLHGGLHGAEEWIKIEQEENVGWWITSALESNIGLNALSHWCATLHNPMPQGLGTGQLFRENCDPQLIIKKDRLWVANIQ